MAGMRLIVAAVEEDLVSGGSSSAAQHNVPMKSKIWKRMNSELLEEVLLFLPSSSQARFRCVCKRWNKLMISPAFLKHTWWVALARTGGDALCILEKFKLDETDPEPLKFKFPPQLKVQRLDVPPELAALALSHRGGGEGAAPDSFKLQAYAHNLVFHVRGGIVAVCLKTEHREGIHRFPERRVWVLDLASNSWTWQEVPRLRIPSYVGVWMFLLAEVTRPRPLQSCDVELGSGCDFELQHVTGEFESTGPREWTIRNCKMYSCTYSAVHMGWQEGEVTAPPEEILKAWTCGCPMRKLFCHVFRTAGWKTGLLKTKRDAYAEAGRADSDPGTTYTACIWLYLHTRPLTWRFRGSNCCVDLTLRFPITGSGEFSMESIKNLPWRAHGHGDSTLSQTVYTKSFSGSDLEGRGLTWRVVCARLVGCTALLVIEVTIKASNLEASSSSRHALAYHVPSATSSWLGPLTAV